MGQTCTGHAGDPQDMLRSQTACEEKMFRHIFLQKCCRYQVEVRLKQHVTVSKGEVCECRRDLWIFPFFHPLEPCALHRKHAGAVQGKDACSLCAHCRQRGCSKFHNQRVVCVGILQASHGDLSITFIFMILLLKKKRYLLYINDSSNGK